MSNWLGFLAYFQIISAFRIEFKFNKKYFGEQKQLDEILFTIIRRRNPSTKWFSLNFRKNWS